MGATANATDPGPVPIEPCVTVIHGAFDSAVHGHAGAVEIAMVPVPPAEPVVWAVGAME